MSQTTMDSPDGWGPPVVLMDVRKSAGLFLDQLPSMWQNMDAGDVCQQIQHSAFPDRYTEQHDTAVQIVHSLWPTVLKPLQAVSAAPVVRIDQQGDGFAMLVWATLPHPTEYRVFRDGQRVQTVAVTRAKVVHNGTFTVAGANSKGMGPTSKPIKIMGL